MPGARETPAKCLLNLKLAGRAEGGEERPEERQGGWGAFTGNENVRISKTLINAEAAAGTMLRLEGTPGSDGN